MIVVCDYCIVFIIKGNSTMKVVSIDGQDMDTISGGAFSAGPDIATSNFSTHPINHDLSFGNHPSFIDTTMARTVLLKDNLGICHISLFDGRPGCHNFPGVTPS
jgi:hypothetical protein